MNQRSGLSIFWVALAVLLTSTGLAQRVGPAAKRGHRDMPSNLPPIVRKALEEGPRLRYAADITIEFRGNGPSRTKVRQVVWKDGPRLRIERPDSGEIVVESNGIRRTFNPSTNEIEEGRTVRDEVLGRLMQSLKMASSGRGKVTTAAGVTIAGRPTEEVTVADAKGNTFQKLWIDVRTGMILKRELYDRVGSVVGLMEVTRIDYSPSFRPGDFEIRRPGAKVVTQVDLARRNARKHGFILALLPENGDYQLSGNTIVGKEKAIAWVVHYQTPRGTLSLVQSKEPLEPGKLARLAGPGRSVHQWQYKGRNFALMGEVQVDVLRTIAGQVEEK